ncbi:hypothetical protein [Luteimonas terrae]|uniref:hypothetical protein n=1 Tax=Luteimonas terrae TaxID=1530191 RepID=UPI00286D3D89|nr:hypothetical protein [Luteimonas terrae]
MRTFVLACLLAGLAGCCAYGSSGGGAQEIWVAAPGSTASISPQEARRECTRACNCHGPEMESCMVERGFHKERQTAAKTCRSPSLF